MKKSLLLVSLLVLGCVLAFSTDIRVFINPYPPFGYLEKGMTKGFSVDVVQAISEELGQTTPLQYMEWEVAFQRLHEDPNVAIPMLIMNPERKELFQWVGPIAIAQTAFYAKKSNDISLNNLEDAKKAPKIIVVENFYSHQLLSRNGFENLAVYPSLEEAFQAFLREENALFPCDNFVLASLLDTHPVSISDLNQVFTFSMDFMYIAFSKTTDEKVVRQWQAALDRLKGNGTFGEIYHKWLPWGEAPGTQVFLSEEYPPLTYTLEDGTSTGFVTDLVKEINRRMGNQETILTLDWNLVYQNALVNPNVVLFSMAQTEERAPLFHWVGPVIQTRASFYKNAASNLAVPSLEYAKKVQKIATTSSWWMEQRLIDEGFENLVSYGSPEKCVDELLKGNVELSVFTDLTVGDIVQNAGYDMDQLQDVLLLESRNVYIGISKGTSPEYLDAFQKAYDSIVMDGTYAQIHERYFSE